MDTGRDKHMIETRTISRIKFFMEAWGLISTFALGIMMLVTVIVQWHTPGHKIIMVWNRYNEAFIEYILGLISIPCILYFFKVSLRRLKDSWEQMDQIGVTT